MNLNQISSLRGHNSSVSSLTYFKYRDQTTLISGDSDGWIIWWNLEIKRPYGVWKGHKDAVIGLQGIEDGLLLSHSKDSTVKVWDILNFKNFNCLIPEYSKYYSDGSKLYESKIAEDYHSPEYIRYDVNTLNFCNISYKDGLLITPATVDSNHIDVYRIEKVHHEKDTAFSRRFKLSRLIANFDPFQSYKKILPHKTNSNNDTLQRPDFGIIMQLTFIDRNHILIGFESGHVIGLRFIEQTPKHKAHHESVQSNSNRNIRASLLTKGIESESKTFDLTLINKDHSLEIFYLCEFHVPYAITFLKYDDLHHQVLCGSAGQKVTIHRFPWKNDSFIELEPVYVNVKHGGVSSIDVSSKYTAIASWDGVMRLFDNDLKRVAKIYRKNTRIQSFTSTIGNSQSNTVPALIKVTKAILVEPTTVNNVEPKSYKTLALRKSSILQRSLSIVSFTDGSITIYENNN